MDYKTEHYVFHCVNNKTAERDIETIAKRQEEAYADITAVLNVRYDFTINYYLVNTPEEVAKMTGYPYPANGLACFSDKSVYAVYSDDVKCIGPHEDAHLISETIGTPDSDFLFYQKKPTGYAGVAKKALASSVKNIYKKTPMC